jgi:hypothetical protein
MKKAKESFYYLIVNIVVLWSILNIGHATSTIQVQEEPEPIGNFSLPKSQRPEAFYSFDSKILEKNQWQVATKPNLFKETQHRYVGMPNTLQYGVRDDLSVLIEVPVTLDIQHKNHLGTSHVSGFENLVLQGEYEFLARESRHTTENAGVILGVALPTGSPQVTSRWSNLFIGSTYAYMQVKSLFFASSGYLIFEGPKSIRPGNVVYLNTGAGYNLKSQSHQYTWIAFLELNAQYNQPDPQAQYIEISRNFFRLRGSALNNGYLLYTTPSIVYANRSWMFQLGASLPISQYWANTSQKADYYASLGIIYTVS